MMTAGRDRNHRVLEDSSFGSVKGCGPGWSGLRRENEKVRLAAEEAWR